MNWHFYWLQKEISAALLIFLSAVRIKHFGNQNWSTTKGFRVCGSIFNVITTATIAQVQKAETCTNTFCTCTHVYSYIVPSAVALKNAGDRLQFHSAFQSWSPHGWWGGDRWTSSFKSFLNVCVCVMFLTSLVTLFIFLFVLLLLLATLNKLEHI